MRMAEIAREVEVEASSRTSLFYMGGSREKRKENEKPRLVVESADERRRIIASIHDQAHLGRDKTLSEVTSRYYWAEMYNDICSYVSISRHTLQSSHSIKNKRWSGQP